MRSVFRPLAVAVLLSFSVAGCGQGNPAKTEAAGGFTQAGDWLGMVEGVGITHDADGALVVTPSTTVQGYQAGSTIPLNGAHNLTLRYEVTMNGGPGFVGVLAGDGSHWLGNYELSGGVRNTKDVTIPVTGDSVTIVIQTGQSTASGTSFIVHKLEYATH